METLYERITDKGMEMLDHEFEKYPALTDLVTKALQEEKYVGMLRYHIVRDIERMDKFEGSIYNYFKECGS